VRPGTPLLGKTLLLLLLAVFTTAASRKLVLAAADWLASERSAAPVQRALGLTPNDAALHTLLGILTAVSDPPASHGALERAVRLNPRSAEAMINLALEAEAHGDPARAALLLERTTAVSARFRPLWTRAGYEFRNGREGEFWRWASAAVNVEHAAVGPVFRLCARTGATPSQIFERLRLRNPGALASFASFAIEQNDARAIATAAARLAAFGREADTPLLFAACERLIDGGSAAEAVAVWNAIVHSRASRLRPLDAAGGASIANAGCEPGPLRAFDWRVRQAPGVSVVRAAAPGGFRVEFSGSQPESVQVIDVAMAVVPESSYELRILHADLPAAADGLRWRVTEIPSGADLVAAPDISRTPAYVLLFETKAGTGLVRLTLEYQRARGTVRLAGALTLRSLAIARTSS
jgi:hypothetical protein